MYSSLKLLKSVICQFIRLKVSYLLPSPCLYDVKCQGLRKGHPSKGEEETRCVHLIHAPWITTKVPPAPKALARPTPSSWLGNDFQIYGLHSQHTRAVRAWEYAALPFQGPHPLSLH